MDGLDSRAALLLFLFLVQRESLCEAAERRTVRAGDTVTLDCGVKHQRETVWFGQRGEEAPVVVVAVSTPLPGEDAGFQKRTAASARLSAQWNSSSSTFSLRIHNISDSDLALYYCGGRANGSWRFENTIRIVFTEEPSDPPVSPPAPCVLSWALLGCVSAGCLLLSGCLCCLWSRRGGVQCVGAQSSPGQSRSEGAAQVEDSEVSYTSLEINTDPHQPRTRPEERKGICTYSEISYGRKE
ncbi:uncharacterized protein LOC136711082 isoform X2 [Amia ocellicauda]|uniref:uncharacterized protein LOC136711082 isoform X2 n=1 Tax=Amia ocellicauda TaxID=2972642 RepID=UPI003464A90D